MRTIADMDVSALGLGCMGMSWMYRPSDRDDDESIAVIHEAIDMGINLFDTADVYGPFTNELLVGRAIADRRGDVRISTKCGAIETSPGTVVRNAHPDYISQACDASLQRLGVDVIDLYLLHRLDPDVPLIESWGAFAQLRAAGKVRAIGLSEIDVAQLTTCHATARVDAVQSELSLWTRDHLETVVAMCGVEGIAFMAYSPLGRGFLTGALSDGPYEDGDIRATNPRFTPQATAMNARILHAVQSVAARKGCTPGQVALAWVLAAGPHVIPIPGTRRRRHLQENVAAVSITLDAADLADLNALPAAVGDRY